MKRATDPSCQTKGRQRKMYIVTTFTAAHAATPANSAAQLRSLDSKWAKIIGIVKYLRHTYKSKVHKGTGYR